MTQILIIAQGLLYIGLVIALLNGRLQRAMPGKAGVLGATGLCLVVHLILTLFIPPEWVTTWLFFVVPGHLLTPAVLLWLGRDKQGE
jgi:hypothetical protein